ncbi:MAG: hypothetical protein Ct9H300mP1_28030 [Planctomycetaceae bacterium]|nr:MAG: hypothetical protein Ct9H300mP1_28030 [Planctomycetaceae bacterium]
MVPELAACHDSPHDHRKAIVVGLQVFLDLLQQGFVGKFNRRAPNAKPSSLRQNCLTNWSRFLVSR